MFVKRVHIEVNLKKLRLVVDSISFFTGQVSANLQNKIGLKLHSIMSNNSLQVGYFCRGRSLQLRGHPLLVIAAFRT